MIFCDVNRMGGFFCKYCVGGALRAGEGNIYPQIAQIFADFWEGIKIDASAGMVHRHRRYGAIGRGLAEACSPSL